MKVVIKAKFIAPTNSRPSRIKLTCLRGSHGLSNSHLALLAWKTNAQGFASVTIPFDQRFSTICEHLNGYDAYVCEAGDEEIYMFDVYNEWEHE